MDGGRKTVHHDMMSPKVLSALISSQSIILLMLRQELTCQRAPFNGSGQFSCLQ